MDQVHTGFRSKAEGGTRIGQVGREIGDLCRSWGRHPSAITLDAGDSHLSWDSVRLMIYETVPYANQNDSSLDAEPAGPASWAIG